MNLKTVLLNGALGVVAGLLLIKLLPRPPLCCCEGSVLLVVACVGGPLFSPLLHGRLLTGLTSVAIGAFHGLVVSALALVTVWIGVSKLTSDETVRRIATRAVEEMKKANEAMEKKVGSRSAEDREQMEKALDDLKEPPTARFAVLSVLLGHTLIPAPLLGILGAYLGSLLFRRRLRQASDRDAGDRMVLPEQPRPWWEEKER